jgi:hypothetical protein
MISTELFPFRGDLLTLLKPAFCRRSDPTDPKVGIALGKLRLARGTSTKGQKGQPYREAFQCSTSGCSRAAHPSEWRRRASLTIVNEVRRSVSL